MPKIIGGSLTEHREETRRRLFAALAELMETRGFDAITLAEIAQTAGIGRTAVYNHVPDKESLLIAFITHETDEYLAALQEALDGTPDPVEQLRTYVRHHLAVRRSFHMPPGLRDALSPATQARLREHARPVEATLRRILADGMAQGVFAPAPLDVAIPLVNSCLTARTTRSGGVDHDTAARATEDFVLRALGASVG